MVQNSRRFSNLIKTFIFVAVLCGCATAQSQPQPQQGKPFTTAPTDVLDVASVAEKLEPAVVNIKAFGSGGSSSRSGFVMGSKGLVFTNFHVISRPERQ